MSKSYPDTIPEPFAGNDQLESAYRMGWNQGHGIACHNVPKLGAKLWTDGLGRVTVDAENIREIHQDLCFAAENNSRQFSPFEFTAHEFNSAPSEFDIDEIEDDQATSEELWNAFETGVNDSIAADLSEYTDEDYGIETHDSDVEN